MAKRKIVAVYSHFPSGREGLNAMSYIDYTDGEGFA